MDVIDKKLIKHHSLNKSTKDLEDVYSFNLNWPKNPLGVQRAIESAEYLETRFEYSEYPGIVRADGEGAVIWRLVPGVGGVYKEWLINENFVLHTKPAPHIDFFYITAYIYVPPEKRCNLTKISDSIILDERYDTVSAGCHFRGAAVATLSIVKEYAQDRLTLQRAMDEYDRRIKELAEEDKEAEETGETPLTDIYEEYILKA